MRCVDSENEAIYTSIEDPQEKPIWIEYSLSSMNN
jgi:hypothetical protein